MNDKITFPRLSTMLADRSGRSKRFSEDFLREFFSLISERLEAGESVKVKGLGTFRLSRVEPRRSVDVTTGQPMEISGHSKVVFVPAKELAEAVNAPFEAFTAIEISDDADLSQIFTKDEIEVRETEDDITAESDFDLCSPVPGETTQATDAEDSSTQDGPKENQDVAEPTAAENMDMPIAPTPTHQADHAEETQVESDTEVDDKHEEAVTTEAEADIKEATEEDETEEQSAEETEEETAYVEPETPRMKTWVKTLLISLGAAAVALLATFAVWYVFTSNDFNGIFNKTASNTPQKPTEGFVADTPKPSEETAPSPATVEDSLSDTQSVTEEGDVPTAPSDAIVYDTISTTRYLTTMAKMHYGNYNLWPYIYEENKAILGHPDRIRPGTAVVIPKLSKFGVDPTNNDEVEKAKRLGAEIYARYGKKI